MPEGIAILEALADAPLEECSRTGFVNDVVAKDLQGVDGCSRAITDG